MAYKVANEGLDKASSRLKLEVTNHETTQLELTQANKRLQAIRNTLHDSERALQESQDAHNETSQKVFHLQHEITLWEEEMDKRDIERADCDVTYNDLLHCRESLREALVELSNKDIPGGLSDPLKTSTQVELEKVLEEKKELSDKITEMKAKKILDCGEEKEYWENKAKSMIEKVKFRSKKEVLER